MKNIEKVNAIFKNVKSMINSNITTDDGRWSWNLSIQKHTATLYSRFSLTEEEVNYVFKEIHKYFKKQQILVSWCNGSLEFWWIHTK